MSLPLQIDEATLAQIFATLFEPTDTLPKLVAAVQLKGCHYATYDALVDAVVAQVEMWPVELQTSFISGHPRIGEKAAISSLSAKEQGVNIATPELLHRLAYLNDCYEHSFPGLRYITFVNGRSRQAIVVEMEDFLHISPDSAPFPGSLTRIEPGSGAWTSELLRAIQDVGRIAKSRAQHVQIQ
ncbi:OHCU-decarbox domain-containing protein [Mycena indigotica]|uniref:OHCU-decarbox domain-containing protein n=1 Tax=Mycena indigotica TaxID=2126181 RepID=A0A8H6W8E4_9AGAR|nr:OHCU-decarbox domain-containing protein [Mycena indigotica]KAF7309584.1 OHCU-decarbox domain-containing protein [Mycena indigotica]